MNRIDIVYRLVRERQRAWRTGARRRASLRRARDPSPPRPPHVERRLERLRRVYYLVTALYWFATVLPMPILVLLAQARGLDLAQVGIFMGVYSLTVALLEVPTGGLADAIGRKRVALIAYGVGFAAKVVLLLAASLLGFLAYALLYGAARALGSGALEAWFVDELQAVDPEIDLQPQLALAGTFELAALALATLVGGALPDLVRALGLAESAPLSPLAAPVLASIGVVVVVVLAVALLVDERARPAAGSDRPTGLPAVLRDALAIAGGNRVVALLLGVAVVQGVALAGVETFWQPFFADTLGLGSDRTVLFGILLAGSFVLGMVGNLAAIPVTRLVQGRHALVAALVQVAEAILLLILARQQGVVAAAGAMWLLYFARGLGGSPLATVFNEEVPAQRRSVMLSVRSLALFAGVSLGSAALGVVAESASIRFAWTLAAAVAVVGVGLLVVVDRIRPAPATASGAPDG